MFGKEKSLHFSLSFQLSLLLLLSLNPPLFLIFLRTEVPACLAHDIDFHQSLEITSELLPGQPASTFLHFCILPRSFFRLFFFHHIGCSSQSDGMTNALRQRGDGRGWRRGQRMVGGDGKGGARRSGGQVEAGGVLERWMAVPGKSKQGHGNSGTQYVCIYVCVCCGGGLLMSPRWTLAGQEGGT